MLAGEWITIDYETFQNDMTTFQIKEKKYVEILREYHGNLLLVGINYDKESKKHTCVIEKWNTYEWSNVRNGSKKT